MDREDCIAVTAGIAESEEIAGIKATLREFFENEEELEPASRYDGDDSGEKEFDNELLFRISQKSDQLKRALHTWCGYTSDRYPERQR